MSTLKFIHVVVGPFESFRQGPFLSKLNATVPLGCTETWLNSILFLCWMSVAMKLQLFVEVLLSATIKLYLRMV